MHKNPHIATAVEKLGGVVATARVLGVDNYQTVQGWLREGNVPGHYARKLDDLSGVSRRLLCKRWRDFWPELADSAQGGAHA